MKLGDYLGHASLDILKSGDIMLAVRVPYLDAVFKMWTDKSLVEYAKSVGSPIFKGSFEAAKGSKSFSNGVIKLVLPVEFIINVDSEITFISSFREYVSLIA